MINIHRSQYVSAVLVMFISTGHFVQERNICKDMGEKSCCDGYEWSDDGETCIPISFIEHSNLQATTPSHQDKEIVAKSIEHEENAIPESMEGLNYASVSGYDASASSEVYNIVSNEELVRDDYFVVPYPASIGYSSEEILNQKPPPVIGMESEDCPDEFVKLYRIGCYYFSSEKNYFNFASEHCNRLGGYLAEIDGANENEALKKIISVVNRNHHLLGATDRDEEGTWIWEHSKRPMVFQDWFRGEPNNYANQDCLVISNYNEFNYQWDDIACYHDFYYLCETDERLESNSTTTSPKDLAPQTNEWDCPEGFSKEGIETCYQLVVKPLNWFEAKDACKELNGYLAIVDTEVENTAVTEMIWQLGHVEVYIGANDAEAEGQWKWVDGTPVAFANWGSGEPNNMYREDCATIKGQDYYQYSRLWNDANCYERKYFLCQTDQRVSKSNRTTILV